jgi:hypothetical protein
MAYFGESGEHARYPYYNRNLKIPNLALETCSQTRKLHIATPAGN